MSGLPETQQQSAPVATAAAADWRARFVQGSFRGVAFVTRQREQSGGRRVALFEIPFRDRPVSEDMGRRAREASIECFVAGPDYMARRDALIDALEAFGPGTLIDPWTGAALQVVVEDYRLSETTDAGGMASFSILFRESGAEAPIVASIDTAEIAKASADAIAAALPEDFAARFSIDNAAGFVEDAAAQLVIDAAAAAEFAAAASGGLGQMLRTFESGLRILPAGTAALLRAPLALGQSLVALVSAVGALAPNARMRLRTLEGLLAFGSALKPVVGATPARERQADNQDAIVHLVRAAAASGLVSAAADIRWTSQADAVATRDRLSAAFDALAIEAADRGDDSRSERFSTLRTALVRDVSARSAGLARAYRWTPRATEPLLTIAQRLHGFAGDLAAQADRIAGMNHIVHPGFVAGGATLDILAEASRG